MTMRRRRLRTSSTPFRKRAVLLLDTYDVRDAVKKDYPQWAASPREFALIAATS